MKSDNLQILKKLQSDAELALLDEISSTQEAVDNLDTKVGERSDSLEKRINEVADSIPTLEALLSRIPIQKGDQGIQGIQGILGPMGPAGHTPVKGKDYFTFQEIQRFKAEITPIKNVDYFDGRDGKDGKDGKGIIGPQGMKGEVPKHEWSGSFLRFENPDGTWGQWANLVGPAGVNYSMFGGGGSTISLRNSGVLITTAIRSLNFTGAAISSITNSDGNIVITISGGGNFVDNEVIAGSGTSWTLASTPSLGSEHIYANGQRISPVTDYSISGANITTVLSWPLGSLTGDYRT